MVLYDLVNAKWPASFTTLKFDMSPYKNILANIVRISNIIDSKITLTYFDGPGRAELSRLILSAGNVKFNDVRHSFESFGKVKADKSSLVWKRFG